MGSDAAMQSEDSELTDAQIKDVELQMAEAPRIEAALKNFLSLRMAQRLAPAEPDPADAAAEGRSESSMDATALQACARDFLRTVNSLELPSVQEWGKLYPQREAEGGLEFMTRLAEYKVTYSLWTRCRGAGQKPAKLLGKTALQRVYPLVAEKTLLAGAATAKVSESQLRSFLDSFSKTFDDDGAHDVESEAALVWTANMNAAVTARQQARQEAASDRLQRATTNDAFAEELRAALGAGGSGEEPGPSIVEVTE